MTRKPTTTSKSQSSPSYVSKRMMFVLRIVIPCGYRITKLSLIYFVINIRDQQLDREIIPQDDCTFLPSKMYSIVQAVIGYYIPILVVVYFYLRVTYTLYQRNMKKKTTKKDIANMFSSPKHKMHRNVMLHESISNRKDTKEEKPLQFDDIINGRTKLDDHHHCSLSRQLNRTVSEKTIKRDTVRGKSWKSCSLPSRSRKLNDSEECILHVVGSEDTARQKFSHINAAFRGDYQENNIAEKGPDYVLNKNLETVVEHVMKEDLSIKVLDEVLLHKRKTFSCNDRCNSLIKENTKKRSNSLRHHSFAVHTGRKERSSDNNEKVEQNVRGWNSNGKSAAPEDELIRNNQNDNANNYVKRVGEFNNGEDSYEDLIVYDRKQSIKTISNIRLQDKVYFDAHGMVSNIIKVPPRKKYLETSVPFKKEQTPNSQLVTQRAQHTQHRRITRTLGIIILVFLICWLPFCIAWPLNTFCECINFDFYDFTYWAAYINSTLNPFLYFGTNRDFRNALNRVMMKYFSKKHIN